LITWGSFKEHAFKKRNSTSYKKSFSEIQSRFQKIGFEKKVLQSILTKCEITDKSLQNCQAISCIIETYKQIEE
jgi:hypothetical protein